MNQPSTMLIMRPSGCGKAYTLLYEIIENEDRFEYILILCHTIQCD